MRAAVTTENNGEAVYGTMSFRLPQLKKFILGNMIEQVVDKDGNEVLRLTKETVGSPQISFVIC